MGDKTENDDGFNNPRFPLMPVERSSALPRDPAFDSSLSLLREGYLFGTNRARSLETDMFRTRLMGRSAVMMYGMEAARIFYEPDRFTRRGAMPATALTLLQDYGSVQSLDGAAHRCRKNVFFALLGPEAAPHFRRHLNAALTSHLALWKAAETIVFHHAVAAVLTEAGLAFCGIEPKRGEPERRERECMAMLDGAGSVGPFHLKAQYLRARCERWARGVVRQAREQPEDGSVVAALAHHRDAHGRLLPVRIAAVELINVLRPLIAIGRFAVFAVLALHRHPEWLERFERGEMVDLLPFAEEVRRHSPFFPMIGGRVLKPFLWHSYDFQTGEWVLLDIYATNHDPRAWEKPERFDPLRFRRKDARPHFPVPQGAGLQTGHRCPGEWLTLAALVDIIAFMAREVTWTVPPQDLSVDLSRMPAGPKDGLVLHIAG